MILFTVLLVGAVFVGVVGGTMIVNALFGKREKPVRKSRTLRRRPMSKLNIPIRTLGVGGRYLAVANIGGITLTGPSSEDEVTAVQSLLWQMGPNAQLTQAPVAIALGLNNQTLADLANGDDIPKAIDGGDSAA